MALASENPYHEGQAYGQGIPEVSDLLFETLYSNTIYEKLDDIVVGKPFVFGKKLPLVAALILYTFLMMVFVYCSCSSYFSKRR